MTCRLGLVDESSALLIVGEEMGSEKLEGDRTLELGVESLVDHAHPATY